MDAYELHDGRFVQEAASSSAANAVQLIGAAVPANTVRTILAAQYYPSVEETKSVYWGVKTAAGTYFPLTFPYSIKLNATVLYFPFVREGMEIKLFPGDQLWVSRESATAGSTMQMVIRYIDTDMPYTSYVEPQRKVMAQKRAAGSVYRASGGISEVGGGSGPGGHGTPGGGGGGAEPY